jgi:hypothetical protein
MKPQTLGYAHGVARVTGLPDQTHGDRPSTELQETDLLLQVRPIVRGGRACITRPPTPQQERLLLSKCHGPCLTLVPRLSAQSVLVYPYIFAASASLTSPLFPRCCRPRSGP